MSKIVITIEDQPGNRVAIHCKPLAQEMIQAAANGHSMTSAEGYALLMLRAVREESKRMEQKGEKGLIIRLPKLRDR
jgi:hypothetical protein